MTRTALFCNSTHYKDVYTKGHHEKLAEIFKLYPQFVTSETVAILGAGQIGRRLIEMLKALQRNTRAQPITGELQLLIKQAITGQCHDRGIANH